MGTQLLRGRFLNQRDDEHAPAAVVIDEVFARTFFPHEDPIGKRLNLVSPDEVNAEIVGVVRHVQQWGLDDDGTEELQAQLYRPFMQLPESAMKLTPTGVNYAVRLSPTAHTSFEAIRHRAASQTMLSRRFMGRRR